MASCVSVAQPGGAPDAGTQGAIHIGTRDHAAFGFTGAKIRLYQDLPQLFDDQRKLAGMFSGARRMFEHHGHRVSIQRVQTFALRQGREQPCEDCLVLGRSRQIVFEIGKNLEMLRQFGIEGSEQEIQQAIAEQNDLQLERNRIGLQRHRAGEAEKSANILDRDLAAPQRPLKRCPAERLLQHTPCVEQEVTAVGAMHRPGLDEAEIRQQRTVQGDILNAADQIAKRRVQFFNDRNRLVAVLSDEDIDLVAVEGTSGSDFARFAAVILALEDEHGEVFDQIGANRLDVLHHPRKVLEGVLGVLDQLVDRVFRRVAAELTRFIAPLRLPSRDLANNMLELFLQGLDDGLYFAALGFGPLAEFIGRDHLAVLGRRQRKAERRPQDSDILFGGLVAERGKGLALPLLE